MCTRPVLFCSPCMQQHAARITVLLLRHVLNTHRMPSAEYLGTMLAYRGTACERLVLQILWGTRRGPVGKSHMPNKRRFQDMSKVGPRQSCVEAKRATTFRRDISLNAVLRVAPATDVISHPNGCRQSRNMQLRPQAPVLICLNDVALAWIGCAGFAARDASIREQQAEECRFCVPVFGQSMCGNHSLGLDEGTGLGSRP